MAEDRSAEIAALARQAVATAGALRLLIERMDAVGWRMQDYRAEDLSEVASALRGTAIVMSMDIGDMDLMEEITGRRMKEIDVQTWLRQHGGADGEQ